MMYLFVLLQHHRVRKAILSMTLQQHLIPNKFVSIVICIESRIFELTDFSPIISITKKKTLNMTSPHKEIILSI